MVHNTGTRSKTRHNGSGRHTHSNQLETHTKKGSAAPAASQPLGTAGSSPPLPHQGSASTFREEAWSLKSPGTLPLSSKSTAVPSKSICCRNRAEALPRLTHVMHVARWQPNRSVLHHKLTPTHHHYTILCVQTYRAQHMHKGSTRRHTRA